MRMIRIIEQISLDSVIQAPGGPDEEWSPAEDLGADIVEGLRRIKSNDALT